MSAPITRPQWGAPPASFDPIARVDQVYVHYTAGSVSGRTRAIEEKAMRAWEAYHRSKGWRSIGYNVLCCQSGRRYIGRGNGGIASTRVSGGHTACCNHTSVAVCGTIGPNERPTPDLIAAIKETLRDWSEAGVTTASPKIDGHRDAPGATTACPGPLYAYLGVIREPLEDDMTPEQEADLKKVTNFVDAFVHALGANTAKGAGKRGGQTVRGFETLKDGLGANNYDGAGARVAAWILGLEQGVVPTHEHESSGGGSQHDHDDRYAEKQHPHTVELR